MPTAHQPQHLLLTVVAVVAHQTLAEAWSAVVAVAKCHTLSSQFQETQ
jgi:hypothetical protein